MKKMILAVMLASIGAAVFATGTAETTGSSSKPFTLEWWTWDPTMKDQNMQIIAKYQAEHPNVKINNTIIDTHEYWTKLRIQAQQRKLPDVFTMSSGYLEEWAESGLMYNLDPLIKRDGTDKKFYKSMMDATKAIAKSDHVYALPFALVTAVLYYNKDMFDAAGVKYPTDDWSWNDFLAAAKKLTIDKNRDGVVDQWGFWFYGRYAQIESWVYANGGNLLNAQKNKFAPDANAIDALNFLYRLVAVEKVAPRQKDMSAFRNQDIFPQGKCAMWIDGSWYVDNHRKTLGNSVKWGISRVPFGPAGKAKRVTYGWPDAYCMSPNTQNVDEAWKFMQYVAGEGIDLSQYMAGKIPSNIALSKGIVDPAQQPGKEMELLNKEAGEPLKTSYTKGWNEWRGYRANEAMGLNGYIDSALNGERTMDQAITAATKDINVVLSRYYK